MSTIKELAYYLKDELNAAGEYAASDDVEIQKLAKDEWRHALLMVEKLSASQKILLKLSLSTKAAIETYVYDYSLFSSVLIVKPTAAGVAQAKKLGRKAIDKDTTFKPVPGQVKFVRVSKWRT